MFIVCHINPEPWRVGPISVARGKGGAIFPRVGQDSQLAAYQEAVRASVIEFLERNNIPLDKAFHSGKVHLTVWFWRRKDVYKAKTGKQVRKHDVDATNMLKATEDALQGLLFDNDVDNHHVEGIRVAQDDRTEPCIVIEVTRYNEIAELERIPEEIYNQVLMPPSWYEEPKPEQLELDVF